MGEKGFSLMELSIALVMVALLGLALSVLFLSGVKTQGETSLLEAQALVQDLWDRLGQDVRSATSNGILSVSGQSPVAGGFILEARFQGSPRCVQYRLSNQVLERREWTGSCTTPSGTFQNFLAPATLPLAEFCYDDVQDPGLVALMDAPCSATSLDGKRLTLRLKGKDHVFPPLVVALRSG